MTTLTQEEIFKGTLWENNPSARKIIMGWIYNFDSHKSEALQDIIEDATGLVGDHLDSDWGNPPAEYNEE